MFLKIVSMITVLIADQLMKQATMFGGGLSNFKIAEVVEFMVVRNEGVAFGMFRGHCFLVVCLVTVILAAVFYFAKSARSVSERQRFCMFMIIGGGASNLLDRMFRGGVIDYINVKLFQFIAFNLADVCICLGCFFLILFMLLDNRKERKKNEK